MKKAIEYKVFQYTLDEVKSLARLYVGNGESISKTLMSWERITRMKDVDEVCFAVEIIEDIRRIAESLDVKGPLHFPENFEWVVAVRQIVKP